jgi:hypothetical protein
LPEKGTVNNTENPIHPLFKTALIAAGSLALTYMLGNCAFTKSAYRNIDNRDGCCRMSGMKGGQIPLQAAHLYHDDGVLGGYNSAENGILMTPWAHGFQHWLIYKWGVGPEFGLSDRDSLGAATACLNTNERAFKRKEGYAFPFDMTPLKQDDILRIALFNASWLSGLQGICLGQAGQVISHFVHGQGPKTSNADWSIPERTPQNHKKVPPISAVTSYRQLNMEERMDEIETVKARLNGDGKWIMQNFIQDPIAGVNKKNKPQVESLVARYNRYAFAE